MSKASKGKHLLQGEYKSDVFSLLSQTKMKQVELSNVKDLKHCLSEEFPHIMSVLNVEVKYITSFKEKILKFFSLMVVKQDRFLWDFHSNWKDQTLSLVTFYA